MQPAARSLRLGLTLLAMTAAVTTVGCGSSETSTKSTAAAAGAMSGSSSTSMSGGSGMAMPARSVKCASPGPGSQTLRTGSHVFIVSVGPSETMYSSPQVRRMHPKSGEVMLGGHMKGSGISGMSGGSSMSGMGGMRHLEVHVCTRRGDKVVTAPPPTIMMVSGSKTQMVPVAEMEGVGEGLKDFHFGNNVQMMKGQTYTVRVTEASDHAVFHVTPGYG